MPQRRARRCFLRAAVACVSITSRSQLPSATRTTLHDSPAVPLLDGDRNESLLEARAAKTSACVRRVSRTVRRAYQMQAPDIKKLSGFPVQLHRHRSEEHTSELQSRPHLVCRLLLEKKKKQN